MSDLEKITTEVPSSSVPLEKSKPIAIDISDLLEQIDNLYDSCEPEAEKCYRKGKIITVKQDNSPETVLNHIIGLYVDQIRNQLTDIKDEEERKNLQVELNRIHNALKVIIGMLNKDHFKLDINSVLHIIHGYVNNNIASVFEHYEIRRRTTHRHDSHRTH